jgi:hypothetical protein
MKIYLALGLLCSCLSSTAWSNNVRPIPISRQLSEADLAIVGRLGGTTSCNVEQIPTPCAELITDTVLKGSPDIPGQHRYVLLSSGIGEDAVNTLFVPANALIFLRQRNGEIYGPLHGVRSVFPLIYYGELR